MQKRYQYCMSGMFAATDQNHYEINIPSPHTYETEEEAMADGAFVVKDHKQLYLKDLVFVWFVMEKKII